MVSPAFNVNNLEQMRAIMEAADKIIRQLLFRLLRVHVNMQVHHFTSFNF